MQEVIESSTRQVQNSTTDTGPTELDPSLLTQVSGGMARIDELSAMARIDELS